MSEGTSEFGWYLAVLGNLLLAVAFVTIDLPLALYFLALSIVSATYVISERFREYFEQNRVRWWSVLGALAVVGALVLTVRLGVA